MKHPKFKVGDRVKIYDNPDGAIRDYRGTYGWVLEVDVSHTEIPYLIDPDVRTNRAGLWFHRGSVKRIKGVNRATND